MRDFLRQWLLAIRTFSRIQVTGTLADLHPGLQALALRHWPGVGLVVGMAACVVFALVSLPLPDTPFSPLVAAVFATGASVLLTGALHEEALQRHASPLVLLLVLAAKLALLALLGGQSPAGVLAALLAAHAVSRLAGVLVAASLPARGTAFPAAAQAGRADVLAALAWCVIPLALLLVEGLPFLLVPLATTALAFAWLRARLRVRSGGFDADALGFAQQLCEVAFYLGAAFGVGR